MSVSNDILNIPEKVPNASLDYKTGHKDARHAAVELIMKDPLEDRLRTAERDVEHWKRVACYLASVHAANTSDVQRSKSSKYDKERQYGILIKCRAYISGQDAPTIHMQHGYNEKDAVLRRLNEDIETLNKVLYPSGCPL